MHRAINTRSIGGYHDTGSSFTRCLGNYPFTERLKALEAHVVYISGFPNSGGADSSARHGNFLATVR